VGYKAKLFISIIVTLGGAAVIAALVSLQANVAWEQVAVLVLFGVLAELLPVPVVRAGSVEAGSVSVGAAVYFAMVLTFPWPVALLAVVCCSILGDILARKAVLKVAFNAGQLACATYLACFIYRMGPAGQFRLTLADVYWAAVAGLAFLLINSTATFTIVALVQGLRPMDIIVGGREILLYDIALYPLGMIVALMVSIDWHSVILLVLPMWLVYLAFSNYMRLYSETITVLERLADLVDRRDPYTARHSERVAKLAAAIARKMGVPERNVSTIIWASRLHDIGKIGWGNDILLKAGPLSLEEMEFARLHPSLGAEITAPLTNYRHGLPLIRHHHERIDGNGYPDGLRGDEIPLGARIICVADAYDAMTSDRPYRKALSHQEALARLRAGAGTQFDPKAVEALIAITGGSERNGGQ
jgi:HD-GYP domain-containing protein (c-di-GMP phosphodiesterase class II)